MGLKLLHIFFFTLLLSINCTSCPSGYFTNNNPCDTKTTLLSSTAFTSATIASGQWHYYYMSLAGINDDFGLTFKVGAPDLEGFIVFAQSGDFQLPDGDYYDNAFYVQNGDLTIPFQVMADEMGSSGSGNMLLGIFNPYNLDVNVQVEYYTEGGDFRKAFNKLIMGIIIVVAGGALVMLCFGFVVKRCMRRRRATIRRANRRPESEVRSQGQGIPVLQLVQTQPNQNNVKSADALTLKEFQRYFPKKSFEKLENQFKQTGCSVCLDEFSGEAVCHQLYCHHIFHEACIQAWLQKQNNCPACRVPLGKKAIQEYLETHKNPREVEIITPKSIKIKAHEVINEP